MIFPPREFSLPFIKKELIAKDTYSFYFDRRNIDFNFLPGQYIRIILPFTNDFYSSRFFTIASSPLDKKYLMITLKEGRSEFKKSLFALQPGELVQCFGPNGGIYFKEDDMHDRVFLAGGLGIVPFYSIIRYVTEEKLSINITLLVSFSYLEDIIYYKELSEIAKKNSHIHIIYTISRDVTMWQGEKGRISEILLRKYIPDLLSPTYYLVGFPEMVNSTEELLENMGVPLKQIKLEAFVGY